MTGPAPLRQSRTPPDDGPDAVVVDVDTGRKYIAVDVLTGAQFTNRLLCAHMASPEAGMSDSYRDALIRAVERTLAANNSEEASRA